MKTFLAIYIGTEDALKRSKWDEQDENRRNKIISSGIHAWMEWGATHASFIAVQGSPLGKTKRISPEGISDTKNTMTGYVVVKAESHEAAAKLFENHPHFTIFPGDSIEIMECLPIPTM